MHNYDTVLKALLQIWQNTLIEWITGAKVRRWLNVELPEVQQTRVDLLGETADKPRRLISVELQSTNDRMLPLRMAEYSLRVYRQYKRFPKQFVLYVGDRKLRMPSQLKGPDHVCRYTVIDIREFDDKVLLDSPFAADNILAILARHRNKRESVRQILGRIATLKDDAREAALAHLTILAGLRKLGDSIKAEVKGMPILDDIMDHDLLGPVIRRGRQEGELTILRGMMEKRFGALPEWAEERLNSLPSASLEELSLRLLDAKDLNELFQ